MFYLVRTPWWLKKIYPSLVWGMPAGGGGRGGDLTISGGDAKVLYLTFDDGPHPVATPFVLDSLKKYGARATFFCIGKNVEAYAEIYARVLMDGHRVGNHTQDHLDGWKTDDRRYLENVGKAARYVDTNLFRPPYGRVGMLQSVLLRRAPFSFKIIMWDVLSADFDTRLSGARCAHNVVQYARSGSIVVFHDSAKAFDRLREALPSVLEHFAILGYRFEGIDLKD